MIVSLLGQVFSLVVLNYDGRVTYELLSRVLYVCMKYGMCGNCNVGGHQRKKLPASR